MTPSSWQPAPEFRCLPCPPDCTVCSSRTRENVFVGAVLCSDVALSPGGVLSRVGLWLTLPPGVDTVRLDVVLDGDPDVVHPTALRSRAANTPRTEAVVWRGASLRTTDLGWSATVVPPLRTPRDGLGTITVVEVAGLTERTGTVGMTLRAVVPETGCLRGRVNLAVGAPTGATGLGAYAALDVSHAEAAYALARWVAGSQGAAEILGRDVAPLRLGVQLDDRGRDDGKYTDARWTRTLAAVARGRALSVELSAPGWTVMAAMGTRARPAVTELVTHGVVLDTHRDAEFTARIAETVAGWTVLQCVAGRWDAGLRPRAVSVWELARGVETVPLEAGWLAQWLRAPGSWARLGEITARGDGVRRWWPGGAAWRDWETPGGAGARSKTVKALWRRAYRGYGASALGQCVEAG